MNPREIEKVGLHPCQLIQAAWRFKVLIPLWPICSNQIVTGYQLWALNSQAVRL